MSLFNELKRRNVLRVGTAYVVVAWLLVQVAETIFPLFGFDETPARIVVIVLAVGLVPALIFAWVFELTPEGLRKEADVDRSQSITPQTGRKLDRVIMVVLALGLAYFAFDKFVLSESREAVIAEKARLAGRAEAVANSYGDVSIAVLPFVDMSTQQDQEYLADGIAEELLNLLSRVQQIRVIARSSAFHFKGKDIPLTTIAEELGVDNILEGSIRKAGNRVRIATILVEPRSGTQVWSASFDRTLDDIFAIQDEIAAEVVSQLSFTLIDGALESRRVDPAAYELFLEGRHLSRRSFSSESGQQAIRLFRRALAIEPEFASAWAELALNILNMGMFGSRPYEEAIEESRKALARALSIDPQHAEALSRMGALVMVYDQDLRAAAGYMERAIAAEPVNPKILGNAANLLTTLGRHQAALQLDEYVARRDPLNPSLLYNLAESYRFTGQPDLAISYYEKALQLDPGSRVVRWGIGAALLVQGRAAEALAQFALEPSDSHRLKGRAMALYSLDRPDEFQAALQELIANAGNTSPVSVAQVYAWTGNVDAAVTWLTRAQEARDALLSRISQNPSVEPIRDDPRWQSALASIGRSQEQLDAIEFEVTRPH